MDLTRALTYKEKVRVIAAMVIILVLVGLFRPYWSHSNDNVNSDSAIVTETQSQSESK